MKCAVELDSDAIIYIPSIMKTGSGKQNLTEGYINTQADRQ
jgi:hypothetical protein